MTICEACGKEMKDRELGNLIGFYLKVTSTTRKEHPELTRIKKIFGRTEFNICYVCRLRAFGIPTLEELEAK